MLVYCQSYRHRTHTFLELLSKFLFGPRSKDQISTGCVLLLRLLASIALRCLGLHVQSTHEVLWEREEWGGGRRLGCRLASNRNPSTGVHRFLLHTARRKLQVWRGVLLDWKLNSSSCCHLFFVCVCGCERLTSKVQSPRGRVKRGR